MNKDRLRELSKKNKSDWLKNAKHRRRFSLYYEIKFRVQLRCLRLRRYFRGF